MASHRFGLQAILSVLLLSSTLAPGALACSCLFTPLKDLSCADYEMVIVGTVVSGPGTGSSPISSSPIIGFSPIAGEELLAASPVLQPDIPVTGPIGFPTSKTLYIQLDECIKDGNNVLPAPGSVLTFTTPSSSAACGVNLPIGQTFILFIFSASGQPFGINLCSPKYFLNDGLLSIIKNKCNACNGCSSGTTPSPILTSPILASPIDSLPIDTFSPFPVGSIPIDSLPAAGDLTTKACANPCALSSCPFFPNADCVVGCGCTAEYLNFDTVVTDQCTCQDAPECLPAPCTVSPPTTDTPTSPSDCQSVTCPFDVTPLCQYIPFANCQDVACQNIVNCFVDPCQVTSCPLNPSATCISNYCGGCNAIFVDPATNEVAKCDFSCSDSCDDLAEFEFSFGLCDLVLGYAKVNGVCKAISGCSSLGFEFFESEKECEEACGCDSTTCKQDPCAAECPNFPEATCTPDFCECEPIFSVPSDTMDSNVVVTPFCEPCSSLTNPSSLFGLCEAILGFAVVDGTCQLVSGCPPGLGYPFFSSLEACVESCACSPNNCKFDPCEVAVCPNFPNVECVPDYCTCQPTFPISVVPVDVAPLCNNCTNFDDPATFFGFCDFPLGYAVVQGQCQLVSGCDSFGFPFFESAAECETCLCKGVDSAVIFGVCQAILGVTVVNGQCQVVSGCDQMGQIFYSSIEECQEQCGCSDFLCEGDPCAGEDCPNFPDAVCVSDLCDCDFEFFVGKTNVTGLCKDDCTFPSDECPELVPLPSPCFYTKAPQGINGCIFGCQQAVCPYDPSDEPLCQFIPFEGDCVDEICTGVQCIVDPCSVNSCPANADAICIANYCDGCQAVFVDPETNQAIADCSSPCEEGYVDCFVNPCDVETCDFFPDVTCTPDFCGGCFAIFTLPDGTDVTEQCTTCTGVFGDVDNSGFSNIQDIVILTGIILGVEEPEDFLCLLVNADVSGDGEISVQDAVQILECILQDLCE